MNHHKDHLFKPFPDTRSGRSVVPTNSPVNEPVKLPVILVSATAPLFIKFVAVTPVDVTDVNPANEAAEAPNATDVEPSVTALFDSCAFVTFAKAPPNVIVGSTVSPSDS